MKNHVTLLTVYCVKAIETNYFKIIHAFMKYFSAQLCKYNCQTKIILSVETQNHPLNQALIPGYLDSQNLNRDCCMLPLFVHKYFSWQKLKNLKFQPATTVPVLRRQPLKFSEHWWKRPIIFDESDKYQSCFTLLYLTIVLCYFYKILIGLDGIPFYMCPQWK